MRTLVDSAPGWGFIATTAGALDDDSDESIRPNAAACVTVHKTRRQHAL
jgi:hypothetical protein